jgi:hypothetical protein
MGKVKLCLLTMKSCFVLHHVRGSHVININGVACGSTTSKSKNIN